MLTTLISEIEKGLRAAFPDTTCEAFPTFRKKIAVPALLIEGDDLTRNGNAGTEQLDVVARFRAYAVCDLATPGAQLAAFNLAASAAVVIHQAGRFGCKVGPAVVSGVDPANFKRELVGFAAWSVEWTHELALGESVWDGEGITPTEIYLGYAPEIGAAHADDYELINEAPDV